MMATLRSTAPEAGVEAWRTNRPASATERIEPLKVFIGAPMSALDPASYTDLRERLLGMIDHIRRAETVESVYFAGSDIASASDFSDPAGAAASDFTALKACDVFVFFYPERSASSVLVELGYALALQKRTIIIVQRVEDIPFLLRHADGEQMRRLLPRIDLIVIGEGEDATSRLLTLLHQD